MVVHAPAERAVLVSERASVDGVRDRFCGNDGRIAELGKDGWIRRVELDGTTESLELSAEF